MAELEGGGVEEVSVEVGLSFAICGIADNGVTDCGHVHPYLVCPAGVGHYTKQCIAVIGRYSLVMGLGVPALVHHGHLPAAVEMPANGGLDNSLRRGCRPDHQSEIGLGNGTFLELC